MGRLLDTSSTAAAFLLLLAALAGCAEEAPLDAPGDVGPGSTGSSSVPAGGGASAGSGAVAPSWQAGQWWRWRLETSAAPTAFEATATVLSADGASYSIGSPDAQAAAQVFPFHLVAFGPVARDTLAWQAHGVPVQFLRFPVVDGDSWTADFWAAPGATVTVRNATVQGPDGPEPGFRSEATYAGGGLFAAASWSPARGQFVQVQSYFGGPQPFATATFVGEGQGGDGGDAQPFTVTDLVRLSSNPSNPPSAAPVEVAVPADAELVLMACFLGGGPGHFEAVFDYQSPPPAQCSATGTDSALRYSALALAAAGGSGRLAVAPAGQGGVTVELFAVDTGASG